MIPKPIHEIGPDELQALIEGGVAEGKTIEYKREMLPGGADSSTVPFLASVSSFANTSGGDLLIGVDADEGLPKALPGVEVASVDKEKLRLEQILANGLEPRLPRVDIHPVQVADGRHVMMVRAPRSWVAPHRVRKNDKFYGRNAAGKYPLDVGELRTAFTLSETVAERIRNFRAERIARIYGRETPVPLHDRGCLVLHLLPLAVFTGQPALDLTEYYSRSRQIWPMGASSWNGLINLDGFVTFTGFHDEDSRAYTQLFRSGTVEAVETLCENEQGVLLPRDYEQVLMDALARYAKVVTDLGVEPPLYVFLSFVGVRGCRLAPDWASGWRKEILPLREDTLLLPKVMVEQADFRPDKVLRPVFDMVWNAFDFPSSPNYDAQGNWVAQGR